MFLTRRILNVILAATLVAATAFTVNVTTPTPVVAAPAVQVQEAAAAAVNCNHALWRQNSLTKSWGFYPYHTGTKNLDCYMSPGMHNWGVVALQATLIECYNQNIALDGIYGSQTRGALRNAQAWEKAIRNLKITVDGLFGPETRRAIQWPIYKTSSNGLDHPAGCGYWSPST